MEAVFTALPEFKFTGHNSEAAPKIRQGYSAVAELVAHLHKLSFQRLPGGNSRTLLRSPGRQLAVPRAGNEILEHLRCRNSLCNAANNHLPVHTHPRKMQTNMGILLYLGNLPAAQIGVEDKSPLIKALEQNNALPGLAVGVDRGNTHRSGI